MVYRRSTSLTPMALRAINYYMRGWTKKEAMEKAGYTEASAIGNAEKFWRSKSVQAEVRERMRKIQVKTDITVESLVRVLLDLLSVTPADLLDSEGKLIPAQDIPPHIARALNFKLTKHGYVAESVDKLRIVELIAKLTGLSREIIEVRGEADLQAKIAAARAQLALEDKSAE